MCEPSPPCLLRFFLSFFFSRTTNFRKKNLSEVTCDGDEEICDGTHPPMPLRFLLLFKTSLMHGSLCEPISNFDTPKGGAVCVGGKESKDSNTPPHSTPSAKKPRALRVPAGNFKSGEFPCRARAHGALPRGVTGDDGSSGSGAGAAREMFEGTGRRVLRGLEYVRRRLVRSTGIDTGSTSIHNDARGGAGRDQKEEERAFSI